MKVDYLLVGQGIAGSMLAWFLRKAGKSVAIVDNPQKSSSSRVAAGLYNPVVFRRMTKSWKADLLVPFLESTYAEMEQTLACSIIRKEQVLKVFTSSEEIKLWEKQWETGDMDNFLSESILENPYPNEVIGSKAAVVLNSGTVDVPEIISAIRSQAEKDSCFFDEAFRFEDLAIKGEGISWKTIEAKKIIFCEGHLSVNNPLFPDLPFQRAKGEVLIIEIPDFDSKHVINKGCFLAPLGDGLFKVGATYEWEDMSEDITEKGRLHLEEKLKNVLQVPYRIIEQKAGVRPTIKDRRPLIGLHAKHKQVGIFNGMGTKGVMLAPYFAHHFVEYLEKRQELMKEVSLQRFEQ